MHANINLLFAVALKLSSHISQASLFQPRASKTFAEMKEKPKAPAVKTAAITRGLKLHF